jgi:hypothetical protein
VLRRFVELTAQSGRYNDAEPYPPSGVKHPLVGNDQRNVFLFFFDPDDRFKCGARRQKRKYAIVAAKPPG